MATTTSTEIVVLGGRGLMAREAADEQQYLTFNLAGEQYGIDILRVQEIRGWTPPTRIPNVPAFVRGVMNLRGAIVPIVDLRGRFGLDTAAYSSTTVVILSMIREEAGDRIVGLVADSVSDVLDIHADQIQPPPHFGSSVQIEFIGGLVALETGMVMLLDVDRLLSVEELFALTATPSQLVA